jgi:RNA polymerase sigma-70 factor (ECF subfamily)
MAPFMSDLELLKRIAKGDEAAFLVLYRRHCDAVYRFAWVLLKSEADAEEVTQDCFLTLARKALDVDPARAQLRTWLLGVTRNLCYRKRRPVLADEILDGPMESPEVEAALIRDETAEAVRLAVMELPDAQREAMLLFEFEEMSLAETAQVLGIEANAVKARLHRGRQQLKKLLTKKLERSV